MNELIDENKVNGYDDDIIDTEFPFEYFEC